MFTSYEQITVNTVTAQSISNLTMPAGTQFVHLQADTAGTVRYAMTGTGTGNTPTNTAGMILTPNTPHSVFGADDIQNIKFIAGTANTKLNVHYKTV